ncbi:cobalamin biosynthesis protein [Deinococcus sp.]|uniref:cobalamin biosynthesis protein n=1 Tax=Deinococcus sp. TaxID=47478 RepID=UPI0025C12C47|nr:cobalamin biosynthesis protein [Deinococcus sp.]
MTAAPDTRRPGVRLPDVGIWPVQAGAVGLAARLERALSGPGRRVTVYRPWTLGRQQDAFRAAYPGARAWVLIGAAGIAVRFLSGLPADKTRDPAVLVLDDAARHVIPILGGHEGGGNALAYAVARACGAAPVITTASEATRPLTLGVGCRRGVPEDRIAAAVTQALTRAGHALDDVREVATVDLKADEPGLNAFCDRHALPLRIIAHADVQARPFVTHPSEWVQRSVGLSGVSEPCALIASPRGELLFPRLALNGVTVAVVRDGPHAPTPSRPPETTA